MKRTFIASLIVLAATSFNLSANEMAVNAQADSKVQAQHNQLRESGFKQTEQQLATLKAELVKQRQALQTANDKLAAQFSTNEDELARLEESLRLETGSLGEVFGVVRQNAKELESELKHSVTGAGDQAYTQVVEEIVAATKLPSMPQLTGLWKALAEQIKASGELAQTQIQLVDGDGKQREESVVRLGSFGLIGEQGYLNWNGAKQTATAYQKQPEQGPSVTGLDELRSGLIQNMVVDPSRGVMLEQLALEPTLMDRLQAGGVVGKIILVLLLIGLIIAVVRGVSLSIARQKIRRQLKIPTQPGDNPLGRVLAVYSKEKKQSVEALELRLLEAVVDEQTGLEKGLSMLKLLAALAPMLGLLGTVTGMIETFQVITQFGNGDPKVMAGGISMALVTTVLGLIAAMPLLLAHNILSSQAESIRHILEKQGIGLVAEQAEKEMDAKVATLGNAA
ncbi:Tol R/Q protein [Vibrio orientalis CIP 102891 = ATCC 33934]|uniref:MotA/TolQ/ExbB proton channel family protein n=1 Tax=Vibrio orientalis CIP 102891 = ATCC 33934 TaxID=675816 RepID=C9QKW1_VIBOR|nr:MotA/TolQ/ExbB proton channel family protein [Vibrio orientalis]EEX92442.1 MotA/TolQ/ExbB proton channel family protein [Vibrio orientalis CIP 102891 = ATCC 33934]EGU49497.1 Tol R/Q protein [Vibrio orientalis CIP 102891 = ATCC 33934]